MRCRRLATPTHMLLLNSCATDVHATSAGVKHTCPSCWWCRIQPQGSFGKRIWAEIRRLGLCPQQGHADALHIGLEQILSPPCTSFPKAGADQFLSHDAGHPPSCHFLPNLPPFLIGICTRVSRLPGCPVSFSCAALMLIVSRAGALLG